jgi:hypothetical protein
MIVDAMKD